MRKDTLFKQSLWARKVGYDVPASNDGGVADEWGEAFSPADNNTQSLHFRLFRVSFALATSPKQWFRRQSWRRRLSGLTVKLGCSGAELTIGEVGADKG